MTRSSPVDVLWVSIGFPPKNDPDGLQVAKCLKYLLAYPDIALSAVTSANPTLWMSTDPTLAKYAEGCEQVIEIPIFEPKLLSIALLRLAAPIAMIPDTRMTFAWQWRTVLRQLRRRPDVIISRSFPLSSTVLAEKLQRHFRVPWILHLTDPWIDSAIMKFRGPSAAYHWWKQRRCFEAASKITLASPRMLDFYRERYPSLAGKFDLFPNIYDEEEVVGEAPPAPTRDRLRVVYTGSLVGDRSIAWFMTAMTRLTKEHPAEATRIDVVIAGDLDSANARAVRDAGLASVRWIGKIPFAEAQVMQRDADVLLLIDNPLRPHESIFLPSKLLDYLATRNPILAITSPGSMTHDLVLDRVGTCVDHGDTSGMMRFLLLKLAEKSAGSPVHGSAPPPPEMYGARFNAGRLREMVLALAAR